MASKSSLDIIAKEIAELELNIQKGVGPEAVKLAEDKITALINQYHLGLEEMMIIDDLVQEILNR